MSGFEERQSWDLDAWPEMYSKLKELQVLIFLSSPDLIPKVLVPAVASRASGCRHCQAHGAYGLDRLGVAPTRYAPYRKDGARSRKIGPAWARQR